MRSSHHNPISLPPGLRLARNWNFPRKLGLLDRLFGAELARHGICWVETAPGPVWMLNLANQTHRWLVYGYYEGPGFWRWLEGRKSEIHTIVDSGANIGQTLVYFHVLAPGARILAYEPGSVARAWLHQCVTENDFSRAQIEASGLGAEGRRAFLKIAGDVDRHGSWNQVSETDGEPIEIVTLDEEIDRLRLSSIDIWKIDMEGHELAALHGAKTALSAKRIRAIHVEAAGKTGHEVLSLLRSHGYTIHRIRPSGQLTAWTNSDAYDNALCLAP